MSTLQKFTMTLVAAAKGNPIVTTVIIFMFYVGFNCLEATIEELVFGSRFLHWLDFVFVGGFMAYAGYAVYGCAKYNQR